MTLRSTLLSGVIALALPTAALAADVPPRPVRTTPAGTIRPRH